MTNEVATQGGSNAAQPILGDPDCAKCGRPAHEGRTFNTTYFPDDCDGYEPMQDEPAAIYVTNKGVTLDSRTDYSQQGDDDANNLQVCTCDQRCPMHERLWTKPTLTTTTEHAGTCAPGCLGCPCRCHLSAGAPGDDRRGAEQPADATEPDPLVRKLDALRAAREVCLAELRDATHGTKLGASGHWGALAEVLADSERHLAGMAPCPEHSGPECLLCANNAAHCCNGAGWIDDGSGQHERPCQECRSTGSLVVQMALRAER